MNRDGRVYFDPQKLNRLLLRSGLSKTKLADDAQMSRGTVTKAFRGEGITQHSAKQIAIALGASEPSALLPTAEPEQPGSLSEPVHVGEWAIENYLGRWITASNGLQFRVSHMRHRYIENRWGRGKWYDLLHLSDKDREQFQSHLVRHPTVCERIGNHPQIAENLSTFPVSHANAWWVIDRWIPGKSLADWLAEGPFPQNRLPRLMTEIALGLEALHRGNVVFRELAPSRVVLAEDDGRAILTDFELAKLLDSPTVSADWPDDPYRAPEVESGLADESADLFSWARILLHAATGELPPKGLDLDVLAGADLPKGVWKAAKDCLAPGPSDRRRHMTSVLKILRRWT